MNSEFAPTPPPAHDASAIRVALAMIAVLCALFGGAFLYAYRQTVIGGRGVVIAQGTEPQAHTGLGNAQEIPAPQNLINVHVAGAVVAPGVYRLPPGSRAVDALEAAGGPSSDADQDAVNLAALVADGDQIVIPRLISPVAKSPSKAGAGSGAPRTPLDKLKDRSDGTVNINTASVSELQRLPGIGPSMAARILAYRAEIGRFTSVEQLMDVSGIGEKKLARMKPFVRIR